MPVCLSDQNWRNSQHLTSCSLCQVCSRKKMKTSLYRCCYISIFYYINVPNIFSRRGRKIYLQQYKRTTLLPACICVCWKLFRLFLSPFVKLPSCDICNIDDYIWVCQSWFLLQNRKREQAFQEHSSSHFTLYLINWVAFQTPLTVLPVALMTTVEAGHPPNMWTPTTNAKI